MFSMISEVLPHHENWGDSLDNAKMLRPELDQIDGFIDDIRHKSLTRKGLDSVPAGLAGTKSLSCTGACKCAATRSSRRAATKFWPIAICVSAKCPGHSLAEHRRNTRPRLVRERP